MIHIPHARPDPVTRTDAERVRLTVIYDNIGYKPGLEADWGFSCLVEGLDEPILFDAGQQPAILISNAEKLGIDLKRIRKVVISHEHADHFGGLAGLLKINPDVTVYLLKSFRPSLKAFILDCGARVVEVAGPVQVGRHALSTGMLEGGMVHEQALLIPTTRGLIILTGCSHPGVVRIAEHAKRLAEQDILLLMGGFHLLHQSEKQVRGIGSALQRLGVRYIAPAHCTGEDAREILREAFGRHFIDCGAGRTVASDDLAD